ncbi:TPA: Dot/Icm T4SS effector MavV [Legionella pneumophila subsp. pneumophila]|uniref:Uncharacterized protein n=1 Tax=Legionella pneumophila (strain Lens) TaxID=297245 RepID=Q5WTG1_LEGPL|nr:Dot/Icm T4SS effector MavV [Legionella pneumophila]AOW53803.1 hypothetical protein BE841_14585 [Legionella pneumophila subsp. pneumophila]AOW56634.1 hypothetical protein BE842_09055 [Legionella pneumophila subsp. pneumophila]AOW65358.1 hypothetical protein BE845_10160 [Legionella pneumophila subsp. pneumophila]RYW83400.1 hypothetical protein D7216_08180 [Legionella pneumophila]RYW89531.1 hypothetical protein D7221_05555 [Legionella pneumophila]
MKYAVTFCTTDQEVGSNPLWHSCLLLSKMDETSKLLEVVDNWGFYGLPTTNRNNSWLDQLKIKMGLDVDLIGNHGMLRHEELRFLDQGYGLRGVTFELTKDDFELLQKKCLQMATDQETAINEFVETQGIKGKPPEKTRIYPHEQFSRLIYATENIKAEQQGREARLKPFELRLSWGLFGPSLALSQNCKTQALSLLSYVLSKEQIERLTEYGEHPTVPRRSGPMESIFLHSTGPLREHRKSSGDVVHYRDLKDPGVKLYWTVPPQELEALSEETIKLLQIDGEYCEEVKAIVRKLQRLEWLLINSNLPEKYRPYKDELINKVVGCYKAFSFIEPKQEEPKLGGWYGWALSLFSAPRSAEERTLQGKIKKAKSLFNSIYMAIVDNYQIDDNAPMENENILPYEETGENRFENMVEAVASYLSRKDKINLCKIIGRTYCEDHVELEDNEGKIALSPQPLAT